MNDLMDGASAGENLFFFCKEFLTEITVDLLMKHRSWLVAGHGDQITNLDGTEDDNKDESASSGCFRQPLTQLQSFYHWTGSLKKNDRPRIGTDIVVSLLMMCVKTLCRDVVRYHIWTSPGHE